MESVLFAVNAVLPLILTVALGYFLKRIRLMNSEFARCANRVNFRVFLPAMLFLNVYEIENSARINMNYALYSLAVTVLVFLVSIPLVKIVTKTPSRRGALLQSSFRSNFALIGIPLAQLLCGSEGVVSAGVLSALIVPLYNILAVISLSMFSESSEKLKFGKVFRGIATNPLIISILAGGLALAVRAFFSNAGVSFRLDSITPLFKVLEYLSALATPLALLVLGAEFEFSAIKELKKEIIYGTLVRCAAVPLFGVGVAFVLFKDSFSAANFASIIAAFATPVAVSSVPMAQEMKSDVTLAGQLLIFTTLFSGLSAGLAAFALKSLGIF